MGETMIIKKFACGLLLSGVMGVAPAMAQSALAQQNAAPSGAQQGQKSSQAKPSTTPTTAAKPATATQPGAKATAAKPATAATTAKKSPPKPVVYVDNPTSKPADASASKSANASASTEKSTTDKSAKPTVVKASDSYAKPSSAKPKLQNADVVKAFQQNCPGIALSDDKKKAGYDVMFEHEPGSKGVKTAFGLTNTVHKTSKIEVTSKSGKEVFSETGHSTSQLVKDACAAIEAPPATKIAKK
jgi:hypothetical protein